MALGRSCRVCTTVGWPWGQNTEMAMSCLLVVEPRVYILIKTGNELLWSTFVCLSLICAYLCTV